VSSVFEQPWTGRHLLVTQRLRHRRDELGLTQKQVVTRLARVGVITTNRALSSLEHGSGLDVAKLPELAHVLDCTVTYLVGLTDDPHSWVPDPEIAMLHPDAKAHTHPNRAPHAHRSGGPHSHSDVPEQHASCILGATFPERPRRLN
jgi:transcriptional regulator with XRE-family HTH domain